MIFRYLKNFASRMNLCVLKPDLLLIRLLMVLFLITVRTICCKLFLFTCQFLADELESVLLSPDQSLQDNEANVGKKEFNTVDVFKCVDKMLPAIVIENTNKEVNVENFHFPKL